MNPYRHSSWSAARIFVVCNQWSQTVESISEAEVVGAIGALVQQTADYAEGVTERLERRDVILAGVERVRG
ncbi:MAG: DUF632 domain-containing protein, partial [Alphaproteobacteria bacterium]